MGGGAFDITRARKGLTWLLRRDYLMLLQIGAIWAAIIAVIFSVLWYGFGVQGMPLHPAYLVTPYFVGALTAAALSEEAWSLNYALEAGRILFWKFFLLGIITSVLVRSGMHLMVLPGVAGAILLTCAAPLRFQEADGVVGALIGSARLVGGRFWRVAALYLMVLAATLLGLAPLFAVVSLLVPFGNNLLGAAIAGVVLQVVSVYLGVAIYREIVFQEDTGEPA